MGDLWNCSTLIIPKFLHATPCYPAIPCHRGLSQCKFCQDKSVRNGKLQGVYNVICGKISVWEWFLPIMCQDLNNGLLLCLPHDKNMPSATEL